MNLNNIIFDLMEIKAESHLYEGNIQYILLKYNFQNIFLSYIGFSKPKKNKFIPSINNETIEKQKLFKINLENEICSQKIIYKENENKNIKKLSVIEQKEPKRNTQLKSNKFWPRFSLLNNIEFFSNKKPKNKSVTINNENRRNSYFIRSMYTNINRRKSLPKKLILKKEDFQLLKLLIQNRKENKFLFEFHKLINIYDINSSDNHGNTLLTYACINGEFQIVKYLLKNGGDPNIKTKIYAQSPVHIAIKNDVDPMILLLLVQFNGSLLDRDKFDKRPIDYINSKEMQDAIEKLKFGKNQLNDKKLALFPLFQTPKKFNGWEISKVFSNTIRSKSSKKDLVINSRTLLKEPGNLKFNIIETNKKEFVNKKENKENKEKENKEPNIRKERLSFISG